MFNVGDSLSLTMTIKIIDERSCKIDYSMHMPVLYVIVFPILGESKKIW